MDNIVNLSGIGPGKARGIIAYRDDNGTFAQVEDLDNVRGIGPKTVEKLREYVRV